MATSSDCDLAGLVMVVVSSRLAAGKLPRRRAAVERRAPGAFDFRYAPGSGAKADIAGGLTRAQ
jgi:hypothetical protein